MQIIDDIIRRSNFWWLDRVTFERLPMTREIIASRKNGDILCGQSGHSKADRLNVHWSKQKQYFRYDDKDPRTRSNSTSCSFRAHSTSEKNGQRSRLKVTTLPSLRAPRPKITESCSPQPSEQGLPRRELSTRTERRSSQRCSTAANKGSNSSRTPSCRLWSDGRRWRQ